MNNNGAGQGFDAADQLCWSLGGATGSTSTTSTCPATPTGATTYGYNARGDRTSVTPGSGQATTLGYDQANRLTSWAQGTTSATYAYSADGLRIGKTVGSTTTSELWDQAAGLPLLLQEKAGTSVTNYIYGPGGLPVEQVNGSTTLYLHHDQLGSTRLVTDANSAVEATYTYSPYGVLTASTGTITNPFLYAGQYFDSESGLYYLRARFYDPATSQLLSRDPALGLTRGAYEYAGNNPLAGGDPTGLCGLWGDDTCAGDAWNGITSAVSTAWNDAGSGVVQAARGIQATVHYEYQHTVVSYGGCFIVCVSGAFQDGYVSANVGCCGLAEKGPALGWANLTPDQRCPYSLYGSAADVVGVNASVGLKSPYSTTSGLQIDPNDWEVDFGLGGGGSLGESKGSDPIPVLPWH